MLPVRSAPQLDLPVFPLPVRWTLRVLAWIAFGVSASLAWHVVTAAPIAGCGVGGEAGCDMVLSSSWSKWLGVPVAVPGLACYATLAALSVLLGVQNPRTSRWINTAFLMLGVLAALASLWFLAIQVFAIGHFCRYCIVTDLCGIAIGALAGWSTARWLQATRHLRRSRTAATGLMALRTALPAATRSTAVPNTPRSAPLPVPRQQPTPSLAIALGGAGAIAVLLIGGQILFPAKSYEMQKVALTETIEMNGTDGNEPAEQGPSDPDTRVAMRVPPESATNDNEPVQETPPDSDVVAAKYEETAQEKEDRTESADEPATKSEPADTAPAITEPARKRLVKFLGGKLTLDVYKHPLIGSPEAPHVVLEMISYDCKHCRKTHPLVKQALSRYGDQVAVLVMIIPMERDCNKLIKTAAASHRGACSTARMALGVATLRPTAFAKFHDWLMTDEEKPPAMDSIVARAYSLVNSDRLRELNGTDQLKKQITGYVDLFERLLKQNSSNKEFGLPVQILGDHIMTGSIEKSADLFKAWEEHLGVKPR